MLLSAGAQSGSVYVSNQSWGRPMGAGLQSLPLPRGDELLGLDRGMSGVQPAHFVLQRLVRRSPRHVCLISWVAEQASIPHSQPVGVADRCLPVGAQQLRASQHSQWKPLGASLCALWVWGWFVSVPDACCALAVASCCVWVWTGVRVQEWQHLMLRAVRVLSQWRDVTAAAWWVLLLRGR
jgi:hypothetical protein